MCIRDSKRISWLKVIRSVDVVTINTSPSLASIFSITDGVAGGISSQKYEEETVLLNKRYVSSESLSMLLIMVSVEISFCKSPSSNWSIKAWLSSILKSSCVSTDKVSQFWTAISSKSIASICKSPSLHAVSYTHLTLPTIYSV